MSCQSNASKQVCAIKGSSTVLSFIIIVPVLYSPIGKRRWGRKQRNLTITVDLYIHNVTFEDEGYYGIFEIYAVTALQVSSKLLSFRRVFHTNTIVTVIHILTYI